ncbi:MAG: class I SAM-dependent methyltransferase [Actinomycetota bacterium]|nr:class I SAM-dependent methyltransferase [Actinomycetota bacterium]
MTRAAGVCRSCGSCDVHVFLDLGKTPLSDRLVRPEDLAGPEAQFRLEVAFCAACSMVQVLEEIPQETLFPSDYPYFSSFSDHVLEHSQRHAQRLAKTRKLGESNLVVELASNDGYLLCNFVDLGIPVLGIDPTPQQCRAANEVGVRTLCRFFSDALAEELVADGFQADVIIANNVMAHIPDLNGFVAGMAALLAPGGLITVENPYVRNLIDHTEFDTIYHEHIFYHSCTGVATLMQRHGLYLNHVEHFPELHGGTLRYHIGHEDARTPTLDSYLAEEASSGLTSVAYYEGFAKRVAAIKGELLRLLSELRSAGKTIAAYGAAAKGSTLLNHVGIGRDLVEFVVDRNVHKQGMHMPGTHQPILPPEALLERMPDYVLLLAWNFKDEIVAQQERYVAQGGRFIVPIPSPAILP